MSGTRSITGSCLCGGVKYTINGPLRDVWGCHCTQCRKTSGHHVAATRVRDKDLKIDDAGTLRWYHSSPTAKRGFCSHCGGNLFWRHSGNDPDADVGYTSIMAGTLDAPTGLKTVMHIFTGDKSDYYQIADGATQHAAWP